MNQLRTIVDYDIIHRLNLRPDTYAHGDIAVYDNLTNTFNIRHNNNLRDDFDSAYISRRFSRHKMVCWVVTINPISFVNTYRQHYRTFQDFFVWLIHFKELSDYDMIIACQYAQHTGLHAHVCVLSPQDLPQEDMTRLNDVFSGQYTIETTELELYTQIKPKTDIECNYTFQKIKSPCSYIHYLQRNQTNTFATICSNKAMGDLIQYFDRKVIFPEGSQPKKMKICDDIKINSTNDLVLFFMRKLHDNVPTYNDVLKDPNVQLYLHVPNLKQIWENCLTQFKASLTHEKNLNFIIQKIESLQRRAHHGCSCPVYELLRHQRIDIDDFEKSFLIWLLGIGHIQKKNVLLFEGPPDTGKSFFARMIWELFYMHERVVNDGLFSFGNAPGSGCLLWEETHIPPELADMAKLIMEGNPSVAVAIKNKPSQILNKRIPMIITNNKELSVYCPSAKDAFDARCFKFKFTETLPRICTNKLHFCPFVYPSDSVYYSNYGTLEDDDTSATYHGAEKASVVDCLEFHELSTDSVLSFIVSCLINQKDILSQIPHNLYSIDTFNSLKKLSESYVCARSSFLLEH